MDITLNQKEIETAIKEFIGNEGINISNKLVEISLTAGRSPNGHSASVTIMPNPGTEEEAVAELDTAEEEVEPETKPAPEKKPGKKTGKKKTEPVVKDALEQNTVELKEQEDEGGFEITDDGPAEPELKLAGEVEGDEDDSLF